MPADPPTLHRPPRRLPPAVIDVMSDAGGVKLRHVAGAIVSAGVVMALLGSLALLNWANELPIGPTSDTILADAQIWHNELTRVGLPIIAEELRAAFRSFQGWGRPRS